MSKKPQHDQPADDWAGLAQNLFGINLDQKEGDDDLLDDDMFKVELPKPVEPPAVISQADVEFAPASEATPVATSESQPKPAAPIAAVVAKPIPKAVPKPTLAARAVVEDDPFGAGVLEEAELVAAAPAKQVVAEVVVNEADADDGLTLPADYDAEGLTLPADYDDGLTLPPETIAQSGDSDDDEVEDDDDTQVLSSERSESGDEKTGEARRRSKHPRRTREDAYWDMLENWEWEEIPESDTPRAEGDRSRSGGRGGDRGGRSGGRGGDRGGRGGDRGPRGRDDRPRTGDRPPRDEVRSTESAPSSGSPVSAGSTTGERPSQSRSGDRPPDDRGPRRDDRPRGGRGGNRDDRPRDDRPREEPRRSTPPVQPIAPVTQPAAEFGDFGFGIFEEQLQPASTPSTHSSTASASDSRREESIAQSSQAADPVLRDAHRSDGRSIEEELVWPDDDSDVRPVASGSVVETFGLPAADVAGESDETVPASDVEQLEADDESLRRPRRRRRRRGPRSESTAPPDGNEGTTFDLSEALVGDTESPDFIPSASGDDSAVSDQFGEGVSTEESADDEERSSERRGSRRRRRRRRPGDAPRSDDANTPAAESAGEGEAVGLREGEDESDDDYVVKPIAYSNIPSWEEAIKYLLQPNLVGRNLGPDDDDESLVNDPRGSGGAEPTSAPPPPRRRGGGRGGSGRGRRP